MGLLNSSRADRDPGVLRELAGRTTQPRGASITPDDARFAPDGANIDGALHN